MPDNIHLDDLITSTSSILSRRLLEEFRDMTRDPNVSSTDYAARLRNVMEAYLEEEPTDATFGPEGI